MTNARSETAEDAVSEAVALLESLGWNLTPPPASNPMGLHIGERVWHRSRREAGTVESLDAYVRVVFDGGGVGMFDANWFRVNGTLLCRHGEELANG